MDMRIVMTFPYALGLPGGGTVDCCETARHLRKAGAQVTLVTVSCHSPTRYPRPQTQGWLLGDEQRQRLEDDSVEVIRVPQHPVHYMLDGLSIRKAVLKILQKHRIDAVLGWHQEVAFVPQLLRSRDITFGMIATMGNASQWYNSCRRISRVIRNLAVVRPLRQADIIFARSNYMRDLVIDLFDVKSERVKVSYGGVESLFTKTRRHFSEPVSRFIFYGSFKLEKGAFETLEALGRVAAQGWCNWTLKIAGWGGESNLQAYAKKLGIDDRIVFLGHLDHAQLVQELAWAQVAILPSHTESFGLAFAESQASGLPVVAYEVGAIPEVVEKNVTGWLVPFGRVDLLAAGIIDAIQNPQKAFRMGLAGKERINKLFSWGKTAETMLTNLEKIKNGKLV